MVAIIENPKHTRSAPRLTLQTTEIGAETTAIRCLDWERDHFNSPILLKIVSVTCKIESEDFGLG